MEMNYINEHDGAPITEEHRTKPYSLRLPILLIDDGLREALMPLGNDFILSTDGRFVGE